MTTKIIKTKDIVLPPEFAKYLSGEKVKISKIKEGILISSIEESINKAKGILKEVYSTKEYFKDKQNEKKLEN